MKKSGEGPGGNFNGPSIRFILKEENLIDLETILPNFEDTLHFTDFLRSIRELHNMVMAKNLENYKDIIENFKTKFFYLYRKPWP